MNHHIPTKAYHFPFQQNSQNSQNIVNLHSKTNNLDSDFLSKSNEKFLMSIDTTRVITNTDTRDLQQHAMVIFLKLPFLTKRLFISISIPHHAIFYFCSMLQFNISLSFANTTVCEDML